LAYSNVNFGFGALNHREQINKIIKTGAKLITVSELDSKITFADYRPFHPSDEAIFVHRSIDIIDHGHFSGSENKFGQKIGDRQFVWVKCKLPNIGICKVITGHMPHPRMGEEIYNAYATNLRHFLSRSRVPVLVSMDANKRVEEDPCHLHRDYNMKWRGNRIDLWAVPNKVEVINWWEDQDPTRNDRHPVVHLVV